MVVVDFDNQGPKLQMIDVLLLCGGRSTEHEISLESCLSVASALDRAKYAPHVVGITREGVWKYYGDAPFAADIGSAGTIHLIDGAPVCFPARDGDGVSLHVSGQTRTVPFAVAFPVLHGAFGEDGTIQGLFQMLGVPYVGCDMTSSANCMDKALTKLILEAGGFHTAPSVTLRRGGDFRIDDIVSRLGLPLFVKPARAGSSIGISKVKTATMLAAALETAFRYDSKVLVESAICGREIECGVLQRGDGTLFAALPGEVVPHAEFYDYDAKYLDAAGASVYSEARLDQPLQDEVRAMAIGAFRELGCSGMARIDFFLTPDGRLILNEVNTIPGFTSISLYPQMMANSGMPYPALLDELIAAARYNFNALNAVEVRK